MPGDSRKIWRRVAPVAALLLTMVGYASASGACEPGSAELAFEELLEAAPDDSPVETEARQVAADQDRKGAFESPETIRRIQEVAARWGYTFDCPSRTYRVAGQPSPDPEAEDDDEDGLDDEEIGTEAPVGSSRPPAPSGAAVVPDGSPTGEGPSSEGAVPGEEASGGDPLAAGPPGPPGHPAVGNSGQAGGARERTAGDKPDGTASGRPQAIPTPGDAPSGSGGFAVTGRLPGRSWWPLMVAGAGALTAAGGVGFQSRLRRRRRLEGFVEAPVMFSPPGKKPRPRI